MMHNSTKQKGNTGLTPLERKHNSRGKSSFLTGLTLVEALMASAIFVVALALIYGMFFSGMDIWGAGRVQADLQAEARRALNLMFSELRNATRTSTQTPSPNLSIPALPNNDEITFYIPVYDYETNTKVWNTGNPIQYQYISADNEIRRLDDAGTTTFARDVADVQFIDINIDPTLSIDELRIILTLNKITERQRNISITLSSIVALRN